MSVSCVCCVSSAKGRSLVQRNSTECGLCVCVCVCIVFPLRRADHLSRGILLSVVYVCVCCVSSAKGRSLVQRNSTECGLCVCVCVCVCVVLPLQRADHLSRGILLSVVYVCVCVCVCDLETTTVRRSRPAFCTTRREEQTVPDNEIWGSICPSRVCRYVMQCSLLERQRRVTTRLTFQNRVLSK
jgi:hypothetical protein